MSAPKTVDSEYLKAQVLQVAERKVDQHALGQLASNWRAQDIPALQRTVVDLQLEALKRGDVDPVFRAFQTALKRVELPSFRLLDAACASGYYREVLKRLDPRPIEYFGSDYSAAMVELAKRYYPDGRFEVQDLTQLTFGDRSFEVVLASGVIEHIPDFRKALAELTRVTKEYLIVHRSPFHSGPEHHFTIGSQYSIETPRIFFSEKEFVRALDNLGFTAVDRIEVYPAPVPALSLRSRVKQVIRAWRRRSPIPHSTLTLVFRRK